MKGVFYFVPSSKLKIERPLTEITGTFPVLFQSSLADFRARGGRVIESWSHQRAPPSNNCRRNCVEKVAIPIHRIFTMSHIWHVWVVLCNIVGALLRVIDSIHQNKLRCKKGMFLYSAASSPVDRSKRFALFPLANLFIPAPT